MLEVVRSGKLQPQQLVTHRFAMSDIMKPYDTFRNAAEDGALKVILAKARLVDEDLQAMSNRNQLCH